MLSRREVLAGGVAGSLVAAPAAAEEQNADREGQMRIEKAVQSAGIQIARAVEAVAYGPIPRLRVLMGDHLKSASKFPDFIDVGIAVFFEMYDWHIRHQQQLIVTRQSDGRYTMQFMFTMLMLRQEVEVNHIGIPYDKA